MIYKSTRGLTKNISFKDATLKGLAEDGGLFVPESWKNINFDFNKNNLTFEETAYKVLKSFTDNSINDKKLKDIIYNSYSKFSNKDVTPLKKISENQWILELFHGPTLAFKDIALQLLGNLFEYYLKVDNKKLIIVGATSGDTGSAAIDAVKNNTNIKIIILHPHKRVSEFQRRQMTTVKSENVYNIAIKGNFDDCQKLIKEIFQDSELNKQTKLGSINSINWTRIMAQISYYIFAYFKQKKINKNKDIVFSVPTGNFGDAYAGYLAKSKFNVPIKKIIVATNKNNILDVFFRTGTYAKTDVSKTLSPSMDIQVASNFERLLYDLSPINNSGIYDLMTKFNKIGHLRVNKNIYKKTVEHFCSYTVSEKETLNTIRSIFNKTKIIIDPHTAVGFCATSKYIKNNNNVDAITLATAHPSKFSEAVHKAIGIIPSLPSNFKNIYDLEEDYQILKNDYLIVKDYIYKIIKSSN